MAIDAAEQSLGQLRVRASAVQAERLLGWAQAWPERIWAVEGAGGIGHLLLPYHHPVVLAKRLATIDVLSRGRMSLLTVGLARPPRPTSTSGHGAGRAAQDAETLVLRHEGAVCARCTEPDYRCASTCCAKTLAGTARIRRSAPTVLR